jgi:phospholipid/cholesterol/gamma-HCH transport system ATP-binding protein
MPINIQQLDFGYGAKPDRLILKGINLTVAPGSVTAIMGGSGSGKTTLLRVIGGLVTPTRGTAQVFGQDVAKLDKQRLYAMRKRMGMLFQFGALFTDLSVFENVAYPLREHTNLPERMIADLVLMKLHAVGLRGACHRVRPRTDFVRRALCRAGPHLAGRDRIADQKSQCRAGRDLDHCQPRY